MPCRRHHFMAVAPLPAGMCSVNALQPQPAVPCRRTVCHPTSEAIINTFSSALSCHHRCPFACTWPVVSAASRRSGPRPDHSYAGPLSRCKSLCALLPSWPLVVVLLIGLSDTPHGSRVALIGCHLATCPAQELPDCLPTSGRIHCDSLNQHFAPEHAICANYHAESCHAFTRRRPSRLAT